MTSGCQRDQIVSVTTNFERVLECVRLAAPPGSRHLRRDRTDFRLWRAIKSNRLNFRSLALMCRLGIISGHHE